MTDPAYGRFEILHDLGPLGFEVAMISTPLGLVRTAATPRENGPAVVFLHGVGLTLDAWTPVVQAARARDQGHRNWVLVDLPGFGASSKLKSGTSIEQMGQAIITIIEHLGYSSYSLVGHSMGGFLALDMAGRTSTGLRSVVAISGAYGGIVQAVNTPLRSLRERPWTWAVYTGLRAASASSLLTRAIPAGAIPLSAMEFVLAPVAGYPHCLPRSFLRLLISGLRGDSFRVAASTGIGYDVRRRWKLIDVPVIATYGSHDVLVTQTDIDLFRETQTSARIMRIEDVGHFAPIERPDIIADIIAGLSEAGDARKDLS